MAADTPLWALLALAAFSAAVSLPSALISLRAWPVGVRRLARDLSERMDALEIEWRKTLGQLRVDVEELEQLEESIERKRARTATAAARAAGATAASPANMNQADLKRLARARGFSV